MLRLVDFMIIIILNCYTAITFLNISKPKIQFHKYNTRSFFGEGVSESVLTNQMLHRFPTTNLIGSRE